MDKTEQSLQIRLTALERRATRYRNAFVLLVVVLAGVVLMGATSDDVQDVVRTKRLVVLNEAGQVVVSATATEGGDGLITVSSKMRKDLIYIGIDASGGGLLKIRAETGRDVIWSGTVVIALANPSISDEITLTLSADFPRSNSAITSQAFLKDDFLLTLDVSTEVTADDGDLVLTPFSVTQDLGFLATGEYEILVTVNGIDFQSYTLVVLDGPPPEGPISMDFDLAAGDQEVRRVGDAVSGAIFELQLTIKDAPELGGWGVDLRYDSDQIRYVSGSFQQSDFLPGFFALTEEEEGLVIPGGGVLGSVTSSQAEGVLGTLSFEVLEGFTDSTELVITRIIYRLTEGRSAEITVRSTAVITSESLVPKLLGDFNGSGKVDLFDFFLFADAFGGTDPAFDLTDDGKVNLADFFVFADAFGNEGQAKLLALAEEYLGLPIQPVLA